MKFLFRCASVLTFASLLSTSVDAYSNVVGAGAAPLNPKTPIAGPTDNQHRGKQRRHHMRGIVRPAQEGLPPLTAPPHKR